VAIKDRSIFFFSLFFHFVGILGFSYLILSIADSLPVSFLFSPLFGPGVIDDDLWSTMK